MFDGADNETLRSARAAVTARHLPGASPHCGLPCALGDVPVLHPGRQLPVICGPGPRRLPATRAALVFAGSRITGHRHGTTPWGEP